MSKHILNVEENVFEGSIRVSCLCGWRMEPVAGSLITNQTWQDARKAFDQHLRLVYLEAKA